MKIAESISIDLNLRQKEICNILIESDIPITLAKLAETCQLTPRIVRYNLRTIKLWFKLKSVVLTAKPGIGINIEADKATRKKLLGLIAKGSDDVSLLSKDKRLRLILFSLLTVREAIPISKFPITVSRSTLYRDLQVIQSYLAKAKLVLQHRQREGFWIEGREISRRYAILEILREELGREGWVDLYNMAFEKEPTFVHSIDETIKAYIVRFNYEKYRLFIEHIEAGLGRKFSVRGCSELLVYLGIMIESIKEGVHLDEEIYDYDILHTREFKIAAMAAREISLSMGLFIPDNEIVRIATLLKSQSYESLNKLQACKDENGQIKPSQARTLSQEIVNLCALHLHPYLMVDQELIQELSAHFSSAAFRLKYEIPGSNPYTNLIINTYPFIASVIEEGALHLGKKINAVVTQEELAYLTMYFAAAMIRLHQVPDVRRPVILVGDGTQASLILLRERMLREFPYVNIIKEINSREQIEVETNKAALVVSLLNRNYSDLQTIHVSPVLNDTEKYSISKSLNKDLGVGRVKENPKSYKSLIDLLETRNVRFLDSVHNWQEAVMLVCEPLLAQNKISVNYISSIVQLLQNHGPYMCIAPHVILLHARPKDGVRQLCMSLLILKEGVDFGDKEKDPIRLIFTLETENEYSHLDALEQLILLVNDQERVVRIAECDLYDDFIYLVWNHALTIKAKQGGDRLF